MSGLLLPLYGWSCLYCELDSHDKCLRAGCSCVCINELRTLETLQRIGNEVEHDLEVFEIAMLETLDALLKEVRK